jgi:hypothetical protein
LDKFWRWLCERKVKVNKVTEPDAEWLELADDAEGNAAPNWMAEVLLGRYLYVRVVYRQLYDVVFGLWNEHRWVLLLGSPGQ